MAEEQTTETQITDTPAGNFIVDPTRELVTDNPYAPSDLAAGGEPVRDGSGDKAVADAGGDSPSDSDDSFLAGIADDILDVVGDAIGDADLGAIAESVVSAVTGGGDAGGGILDGLGVNSDLIQVVSDVVAGESSILQELGLPDDILTNFNAPALVALVADAGENPMLPESITDGLGAIQEVIGDFGVGDLGDDITDIVEGTLGVYHDIVDDINVVISDVAGDAIGIGMDILGVADTTGSAAIDTEGLLDNLIDLSEDSPIDIITEAIGAIGDAATEALGSVEGIVLDLPDTIGGIVSDVLNGDLTPSAALTPLSAAIQTTAEQLADVTADVSNAGAHLLDSVNVAMDSTDGSAADTLGSILDNIGLSGDLFNMPDLQGTLDGVAGQLATANDRELHTTLLDAALDHGAIQYAYATTGELLQRVGAEKLLNPRQVELLTDAVAITPTSASSIVEFAQDLADGNDITVDHVLNLMDDQVSISKSYPGEVLPSALYSAAPTQFDAVNELLTIANSSDGTQSDIATATQAYRDIRTKLNTVVDIDDSPVTQAIAAKVDAAVEASIVSLLGADNNLGIKRELSTTEVNALRTMKTRVQPAQAVKEYISEQVASPAIAAYIKPRILDAVESTYVIKEYAIELAGELETLKAQSGQSGINASSIATLNALDTTLEDLTTKLVGQEYIPDIETVVNGMFNGVTDAGVSWDISELKGKVVKHLNDKGGNSNTQEIQTQIQVLQEEIAVTVAASEGKAPRITAVQEIIDTAVTHNSHDRTVAGRIDTAYNTLHSLQTLPFTDDNVMEHIERVTDVLQVLNVTPPLDVDQVNVTDRQRQISRYPITLDLVEYREGVMSNVIDKVAATIRANDLTPSDVTEILAARPVPIVQAAQVSAAGKEYHQSVVDNLALILVDQPDALVISVLEDTNPPKAAIEKIYHAARLEGRSAITAIL